ncbi:MAG TPA: DUF3526 domain-containing protein [Sphingomicrobium sp.]|nr:DUF3526 domain-containing protein [Sphingomicrobium sp.]
MSRALTIARDELRLLVRNRVAMLALAMLVMLSAIAAVTSIAHQQHFDGLRHRFQAEADREFDNQPDRHPHRVVHYGHFVFRPLGPLAAFDPGVDPFTGNAMFLEGHRQNSANFSDVRQSSLLIRFGQLTPAFVLQALAPLVLIFLGYGVVARERERGTLRQMLMQGVSGRQLAFGKLAALLAAAALVALPALLALAVIAVGAEASAAPAALLGLGYLIYLAGWAVLIVLVSTLVRHMRAALLGLLAIWAITVVLVPRVAPELALAARPLPTRLETDVAIARDLRSLGDSHNPDDPHFAEFKRRTLERYGAATVEELPVNYRGLLALEGERISSELFDRYARENFDRQAAQSRIVDALAVVSPTVAVRRLSMEAAGTGLDAHRRFLDQSEAYRFDIVQRLNRLQAEAVDAADDAAKSDDPAADRRSRIDRSHWHHIPDFVFRPAPPSALAQAALPGLTVLIVWLAALLALVGLASKSLEEKRA